MDKPSWWPEEGYCWCEECREETLTIARALVEHLEGACPHACRITTIKRRCPMCWQQIRKEVGLE